MAAPSGFTHRMIEKAERIAALTAALLAGAVFFYHMSPEVTLQDSGELVTAAFTLGVPHPPGYPLWTLLGFLWSHLVVPFGNPAWRIGTFSVVTGALLVGVMALTTIRCTRRLLDSLPWNENVDGRAQRWIAMTAGVSTALLFGFNRAVWCGACEPGPQALQVLLAVSACCAFVTWLVQPDCRGFLYVAIVLFAVDSDVYGWTGHAVAISIYLGSLAAGIERYLHGRRETPPQPGFFRALMPSLSVFWELCMAGLLGFVLWKLLVAWVAMPRFNAISYDPWPLAISVTLVVLLAVAGWFTGWWSLRRAFACFGVFVAGVAINLYLPLAAATNPPMNWGYAASRDMFFHMMLGGSYLTGWQTMSGLDVFPVLKGFTATLMEQYSLPLTLVSLPPLAVMAVCRSRPKTCSRAWLIYLWIAFVTVGLSVLPAIQWRSAYPEYLWSGLAPAQAFYALLIGLGIAASLSLVAGRGPNGSGVFVRWVCVGLLALPLITFTRNVSVCSQRGHDSGHRFGRLMFEPGNGVPPMEKGAILLAGTDAGRFVATYRVFCERQRSDVCVIAQNALADNTYMNYIRDQYDVSRPDATRPETMVQYPAWRRFMFGLGWKYLGRDHAYPVTPIHIPGQDDSNRAFQEYVKEVQSGRLAADLSPKSGLGYLSGFTVGGVMNINGILAHWIFDRNKDSHAFYVEESYVIRWMYPYLRPCGVIMKLEKDPLPSPEQDPKLWEGIVAQDRAYWDTLTSELLARAGFRSDADARKTFAKLRCAMGGLYLTRGLTVDAEFAFRQALQLCPASRDANFRLADLYAHDRRYDQALKVMEDYWTRYADAGDRIAQEFIEHLKTLQREDKRREGLELERGRKELDPSVAVELATLYQHLNREPQFKDLAQGLLSGTNLPPPAYATLRDLCVQDRQWDLLTNALQSHLTYDPKDYRAWMDLAYVEWMLKTAAGSTDWTDVLAALRRAVEVGGEAARTALRQDRRLGPLLRNTAEFKALVPEQSSWPFAP